MRNFKKFVVLLLILCCTIVVLPVTANAKNPDSPGRVQNIRLASTCNNIIARFSKVEDAYSYQIRYSASRNFSNAKTLSTRQNTCTIRGLKKGAVYYVQIRALANSDKGDWSSTYKITIK